LERVADKQGDRHSAAVILPWAKKNEINVIFALNAPSTSNQICWYRQQRGEGCGRRDVAVIILGNSFLIRCCWCRQQRGGEGYGRRDIVVIIAAATAYSVTAV